jgi:hypothetical protein
MNRGKFRPLVTAALLVTTALLLRGALVAQQPAEWSNWLRLTNADSDKAAATTTWRWRKVAVPGAKNVPLEIEIRDSAAAGTAMRTFTVLYERAIENAAYQRNAPTRELCYLNCTAVASAEGARCTWAGSDAEGTRVMETRLLNPPDSAK